MKFQRALAHRWQTKGFAQATPIQEEAFAPIKAGQSVCLHSATGTGKTLAYLLPLFEKIQANHNLQVVVFAPSQELALQIMRVAQEWSKDLGIIVQSLAGGANKDRQINNLKEKPEVIVATPDRFQEVLNHSRKLKIHTVSTLVYDEADILFGTEHQGKMLAIQKRFMRDVQKIWVSASLSEEVVQDIQTIEEDVQVLSINQNLPHIAHYYIVTQNRKKVEQLRHLAHIPGMKAIVFVNKIEDIQELEEKLAYHKIAYVALHSDMNQMLRKQAIASFSDSNHPLTFLLTTDVASRGLDIDNISFVIHYQKVADAQTYRHRSGRTGRMGKDGTVISLVNEHEGRQLQAMLAQEDYKLEEGVIYNHQLMTLEAQDALRLELGHSPTKMKSRSKMSSDSQRDKSHRASRHSPSSQAKKRKNRIKYQKNKGKPRGNL